MKRKTKILNSMAAEKIKYDSSKDIYRGQLFLFLGENPVAFASSCSLEISIEEIDISNKMMGDWAASLPGKKSFTISSESLLTRKEGATSYDLLLSHVDSGETFQFVMGEALITNKTNVGGEFSLDATKVQYKGEIMLTSLSLKSDNGQIATCSASFKGVGALQKVTPSGGEAPNPDL